MINQSDVVAEAKLMLKASTNSVAITQSDVVAQAREILADTVTPYRWADTQLNAFYADGITELKKIRDDLNRTDSVLSTDYELSLTNYVVSRAFALDNDAQNNNGGLSDKHFNLFVTLGKSAPYQFKATELTSLADDAVNQLYSARIDLFISLSGTVNAPITTTGGVTQYNLDDKFRKPLACFVAMHEGIKSGSSEIEYFAGVWKNAFTM